MEGAYIEDQDGRRICFGIPKRAFDLFGLSLDGRAAADADEHLSFWMSADKQAIGVVFRQGCTFGHLVMRRRGDQRWALVSQTNNLSSAEIAADKMVDAMRVGEPPEGVPPGATPRPPLYEGKGAGTYAVLTDGYAHYPAAVVMQELYLALPRPDKNFASDMRSANFDSRMWELYLLACFREQGITVRQDHPSPDFFLERQGATAYVEAVTAHSISGPIQMPSRPTFAPTDPGERQAGAAAARFAKTLRSKLQKNYQAFAHVQGNPFALAIADFHQSASMVWSRESLPCYIYGFVTEVIETPDGPVASRRAISHLQDNNKLPTGLFLDPANRHLSAIIFSNAGTMAKFNRMGYLAGLRPPGLRMERYGLIFDRRPGVLDPIEFRGDILSAEYEALWPGGECWCQELEVYHNPLAAYPISHALFPGASHWFERDGEIVCEAYWENTFLSSVTALKWDQEEIDRALESAGAEPRLL